MTDLIVYSILLVLAIAVGASVLWWSKRTTDAVYRLSLQRFEQVAESVRATNRPGGVVMTPPSEPDKLGKFVASALQQMGTSWETAVAEDRVRIVVLPPAERDGANRPLAEPLHQ